MRLCAPARDISLPGRFAIENKLRQWYLTAIRGALGKTRGAAFMPPRARKLIGRREVKGVSKWDGTGLGGTIRSEYERLDRQWARLHYRATVGLVLAGMVIELFFGISHYLTIEKEGWAGLPAYALRYMGTSTLLNGFLLLATVLVMRLKSLSQRARVYILSLALVGNMFVFYANNNEPYMSFIFFVPIILSAFYCELPLSISVMALSFLLKLTADFLIFWDPDKFPNPQPWEQVLRIIVSALVLVLFQGMVGLITSYTKKKNDAALEMVEERVRMRRKLVTDPLTGIGNRMGLRDMFEVIEREGAQSCICAMMDLDGFKQVNDRRGHAEGDLYLRKMGEILSARSSEKLLAYRYGGDEFCLLFLGMGKKEAEAVCRGVQREYAAGDWGQADISKSLSVGLAAYRRGMFAEDMMQAADTALYRAKENRGSLAWADEEKETDAREPHGAGRP